MCQRVQCPACDRSTYAGCGRHVERVLGDVAPTDRDQCGDERPLAASLLDRADGAHTVVAALDPRMFVSVTGNDELEPIAADAGRRIDVALASLSAPTP